MESSPSEPESDMQPVEVSLCDRWRVRQRLLELSIPAVCSADGYLRVEVNNSVAALQVRSVLRQFGASRAELVGWLEDCWCQTSPDRAA